MLDRTIHDIHNTIHNTYIHTYAYITYIHEFTYITLKQVTTRGVTRAQFIIQSHSTCHVLPFI